MISREEAGSILKNFSAFYTRLKKCAVVANKLLTT
jgi:hypothetical protein